MKKNHVHFPQKPFLQLKTKTMEILDDKRGKKKKIRKTVTDPESCTQKKPELCNYTVLRVSSHQN